MKELISIFSILFSLNAFSHGMNNLGPNGGFITMPSNYHIELVSAQWLKIYFLDINFKKIPLKKQEVEVSLVSKKNENYLLPCHINIDHFSCSLRGKFLNEQKEIQIKSKLSKKEKFNMSIYSIPLKVK